MYGAGPSPDHGRNASNSQVPVQVGCNTVGEVEVEVEVEVLWCCVLCAVCCGGGCCAALRCSAAGRG
jgi:hypothetical protein